MQEMNRFLRLARISRRMTHQRLADAVGVSSRQIREMERGQANPSLALCLRICHVLGRSLDDLFWVDESAPLPTIGRERKMACLCEVRRQKRLSKTALAAKAGTSRQVITALEKGCYNPSLHMALSICLVLGRSLDEIFWEEAKPSPGVEERQVSS